MRTWTGRIGGLAALALALAAVVALAACGGGAASDPAAAPATAERPPSTAAPTTQPPATSKPSAERIPVLSGGKASKRDVRWVQQHLGRLHPDVKRMVGKADGRMGPRLVRRCACTARS